MRALKILGLAIGALVALGGIALIAVYLLFDPNDYKNRIAQAVKSSTGRELSMPGDIKLSLFPWLALEIGPASLGNPPGFGPQPFALVKRAALRVRLLPLLHKQVQIGRVEIDGLDLRLQRSAAGKGNWEDLDDAASQTEATGKSKQPLDLAGVVVTDSRISFADLVADKVTIDVGRIAPGVAIPVRMSLDLRTAAAAKPISLEGSLDLTMDLEDRYRLARVDLGGTLTPGAVEIPWKLASPEVSVDIGEQTVVARVVAAQFAAAKITGSLNGTQINDKPAVQGEFDLQTVALRELLGQIGTIAPNTRDAKALASLAARGAYRYSDEALRTDELVVQLDDSALTGSATMNLESGAIDFDIAVDRLDADRYLPPPSKAPAAGKKAPFELPTDALKGLLAKGRMEIGQAKIAGIALSSMSLGLDAREGVTRLSPLKAQLYGGQYSGEITVDSRNGQPVLKLEQTMTGIDVAQLLGALAETKRLAGRGNVSTSLTAQGRNSDALIRSLRGRMTANLADGAVEGIDLWYAVNQVQSLLDKQTLAGATNSGRTAFDTFRASADVAGGVATTDDLNIVSRQLRVTGKGSTNLATQKLDYQVTATVLKSSGSTLAAIPVGITGTFDNPKVRPDVEGMLKDKLKDKLSDKLKEILGR